ncbi:bifunctional N-acetylglucosamine-1-phosphate uridyltransferase/glucosamine-1-phosphate acetyltransferase [Candidatus Margulisiibacteriota bacterium]
MKNINIVILAAGMGTRMVSQKPKVMHILGNMTLVEYVIHAAQKLTNNKMHLVIGYQAEFVKNTLKRYKNLNFIYQKEQLGTGHAVKMAMKSLPQKGITVVLNGDIPLIKDETIQDLINFHIARNSSATVLTTHLENPFGYGRVVRDKMAELEKIVEEKDCSNGEHQIDEINAGIYAFNNEHLNASLKKLKTDNKQKEYYLTDVIQILRKMGKKVFPYSTPDHDEVLGINNRHELIKAASILKQRKINELIDSGVTVLDPITTSIDQDVKIGVDTVIYPNTTICGETSIGEDCRIGPFVHLEDTEIPNNTVISTPFKSHVPE